MKKRIIFITLMISGLIYLAYGEAKQNPPVTSNITKQTKPILIDSPNVKKVEKEKPVKKRAVPLVDTQQPKVVNHTIPKSDSPFINRLNKIRVAAGLKPFYQSDQLNADAQRWSNEMSRTGYRHSGYGGEVIAYSCDGYFKDVLQAWLDSPPHKAILMGYGTYIGYGQVQKGNCVYYTSWVG